MIELKVEIKGLDKALRGLDSKTVRRAASHAINDTAKAAKVEASRQIREDFNLPKREVDARLKIGKSVVGTLEGRITATGRSIGLLRFGARWVRGARTVRSAGKKGERTLVSKVGKRRARTQGVVATIRRGRQTVLPHAFIARGKRGGGSNAQLSSETAQVWVRGESRKTLIPKRIPSVATLMAREKAMRPIRSKINSTFQKRFDYHRARLSK